MMQLRSHQKHEIIGFILYWEFFTARPAQILQLPDDGFACPWNRQVKTPASETMPRRTQLQIEDGHK